jgi:hypothetical protein
MLDFMFCPVCIEGKLHISVTDTHSAYNEEFNLDDVDKLFESTIAEYWVFRCDNCDATQKYNFYDIEKLARKEISKRIMTLRASKELEKTINMEIKHYIYCGVCNGYDSKGSCPPQVYYDCQLRRIPSGL